MRLPQLHLVSFVLGRPHPDGAGPPKTGTPAAFRGGTSGKRPTWGLLSKQALTCHCKGPWFCSVPLCFFVKQWETHCCPALLMLMLLVMLLVMLLIHFHHFHHFHQSTSQVRE